VKGYLLCKGVNLQDTGISQLLFHQYISSEGFLVMASAELLLQLYTPFVLSCIQGFLFHNQATQTFYGYYIQASPRPCS